MSNELFRRRSLESLRKEAKRWLAALRANDAPSRERLLSALPNAPEHPTLRDVQLALAREHGFSGWHALTEAIAAERAARTASMSQFETMVDALLEAYRTGTPEAMERHYAYTWHRRAWPALRTYVQLDVGKRPASPGGDVDISRDDARYLVARDNGFPTWQALTDAVRANALPVRPPSRSRREITNETLALFDNVEQIESLDLSGTAVTDAGAAHLARFRALRELNLSGTATGDGAIRALAGMPQLHTLHTGNLVTDAGIPLLHEIPAFKTWAAERGSAALLDKDVNPTRLVLRGTFTDRGMQHLRGLDGLYALDVDDAALAITANAMRPVAELPNLGRLSADAKDDWMPIIARMPALRFLSVQDTPAGDDGFVALSASATIESVWGRRCHNLGTRGFLALANMPALRALSVSCLNVSDQGIAALPSFPSLVELMPMDVPDAGYRHIGRCERLESLILMYCRDTTDAATAHIVSLPRLSYYFNSYTVITDRTPELLATMPSLERVTFDACHKLTNAGVAKLAALPRLRELRVAGRGLTADVAAAFPPRVDVHFSL